ncbi:MAG: hypothetical protein VW881_01840, partial [Alphaproteobacteria bacterium]
FCLLFLFYQNVTIGRPKEHMPYERHKYRNRPGNQLFETIYHARQQQAGFADIGSQQALELPKVANRQRPPA